jgi:hypothetical protein
VTRASPGVVLLTAAGAVAAVYAFICHIRAERLARVTMNRVRATQPGVWQRLIADHWLLRIANPAITIKVWRARHGSPDAHFDDELERVRRIERQEYVAVGAAGVCIALVLVGTRYWGWSW